MKLFRAVCIAGFSVGVGLSSVGTADAACEFQWSTIANYCTANSQIRLTGVKGFPNDWWEADLNGTGLSQAFATLKCKNAGVWTILYSGIVNNHDNFECGQGAAINYSIAHSSSCGTDATC